MRRAAKVDRNQSEIVQALRRSGAVVLITSQLKNCFDILVFSKGAIYPMEIKDGLLSASRKKLTEGEQEFKDKIEAVDCVYHVVESVKEALAVIGVNLKE